MRFRFAMVLAALAFAMSAVPASAQVQTGEISGRVTDNTGAVVPGVNITLSGPAIPQPLTTVSSPTGSFQFTRLPIGTYNLRFELQGFRTVNREGIRVDIGSTVNITQAIEVSAIQEEVTVTGESPIVDAKSTTTKTAFDLDMLQKLPSARDPWVMLERVPNIAMDRVNVGGTQSGQQSGYISRGSGSGNNKWSLDGVDITDMSATGASPIYYDFDMLQEMSVTTGGADASQQTGGVGINFVTRSGTNRFRGSGRLYNTNERFQSDNVTDEIRAAGAGSGNPIQDIIDTGFEVGGPIRTDSLWYWGSYGKQDIKVGVIGFYQNTPTCRPTDPLTGRTATNARIPALLDTQTLRDCAATDQTLLNNYNWKLTWAPTRNNKLNFQNTWAEKVRNARDASDTRPLETAYRQKAVDSTFGRFGWITGPSPIWKLSDQHLFTDRFVMDIQLAHVGNNFTLTFQDPAQRDVQPRLDIATNIWGRSFNESVFMRPTDSVDLTASYFLPAFLGGDHSLRAGYRWRVARGETISHTGGNVIARFSGATPNSAEFYRDGYTNYGLDTHALYIQDTFSLNRLTLNLGVRWDRQTDEALPGEVPANPLIPNIMPAIQFPGLNAGVVWNDISPRLGLTYDLTGQGRTIAKSSWATYYGQLAPGQLTGNLISIAQVNVRYGWNDANGDTFVQVNEVDFGTVLARSGTFNPADPTNFRSPGTVDPNVKNDRTREFMIGMQHELARNLGFEVNYIWRKYDQFAWSDRPNWDPSTFQAFTLNPTNCSAAAVCAPITYYRPTSTLPAPFVYTNQPDRWRNYNGVEMALMKRLSDRWMASASFAFNDAKDHWGSEAAYEDPTNIQMLNGYEFAPESGGSGIDNVFTNAKWLVKASGLYIGPWDIGIGGNLQYRQGYPYPIAIRVTNRGGSVGDTDVLIEPMGERRHPNFIYGDLKFERAFRFNRLEVVPSMDIFNVGNVNTIMARRRLHYTYNASTGVGSSPENTDLISGIVAPRVIRFGVRVNW